MVGMTMIFYWSCLALLDLWSALLTLCVALLLVESPYPDHFFCKKMVNEACQGFTSWHAVPLHAA